MRLSLRSVRTRLVILVASVALAVGGFATLFDLAGSQVLIREQLERRGRYIATNLAFNSSYGVLTEDRSLLSQYLEGAVSAGGAEGSDVAGALVRNANGVILAQRGASIKDLPPSLPPEPAHLEALTMEGEPIVLFRAPVKSASSGGEMAAELGLASDNKEKGTLKGGVEVAISKAGLQAQQRRLLIEATFVGWVLVSLGGLAGWFLVGLWFRPLAHMAEVSSAVAKGDLTPKLSVTTDDEMGVLAKSLNDMVSNLRRIVDNIQDASVQVASSAGEISANSRLINQGAQGQAQAAEETSTSMEEMAASIQTVAGNAQSLASYVEETSSSITEMGASIEQVAKSTGLLASTVTEASAIIEQMTLSIDRMAKGLESLAGTVADTSATVEEMTTFIGAVARNAETLSTAAAKTSHTVTEMTGAIGDVAEIAEEADTISQRARQDAQTGDQAVARTVDGMKNISETMDATARVITGLGRRSQEIGRILEVIEEIADQTNLLALNAAIEAARAGEAGRGFAVVADEVRKLAERSVEAAKEIGEVVRQVQQETTDAVEAAKAGASKTREGIALADQAGLALRRILESVTRSSQLMAQIASATAKQSRASAEVRDTVANMATVTGQVTSAVHEQAAGSKQIREAMENIKKIMTEAAHSTREQSAGGRQVRQAVENMNRIAGQVGIATREQAEGSRSIIRAVENMNAMTQQVSHATAEQKKGGELVVRAMENISEIARDNLATVEEMSKATTNLAHQAENLAKLVSVFQLQ